MQEDQPDTDHQKMVDAVLSFFFLTYGIESKQRFETDENFANTLNTAAMSSMAIIAIACMEDDPQFKKMSQQLIGNPKNECDEVAALRICVLTNFVPESFKEMDGIVPRLNWFREAYIDARGGSLPHSYKLQ